jgi:hypothetical protein
MKIVLCFLACWRVCPEMNANGVILVHRILLGMAEYSRTGNQELNAFHLAYLLYSKQNFEK